MQRIMFNDKYGLTKAVLEGRKTQTRRVIEKRLMDKIQSFQEDYFNATLDCLKGKELIEAYFLNYPKKLPYKVGEIVAVAQSYVTISESISENPSTAKALFYCNIMKRCYPKEEIPRDVEDIAGWTNKMFVKAELMPHQIRITNVRVEKLEDISEQDAIAEGITYVGLTQDEYGEPMFVIDGCKETFSSARDAYSWLIDKISGKGTWESNPYVFVYDFELAR